MKYLKIKNDEQYNQYCEQHEKLTYANYMANKDEIELIEILIDEYEHRTIEHSSKMNPVEIIVYLLEENQLTKSELANELGVSRQLVTDILKYRRNISKNMILKLSERFKMRPAAFSRPYQLKIQKKGELSKV